MMGSCTYLMVACMVDTENVKGKDDLGSQERSSSHAVLYFFIRSSRSSPLPLQLVIKCAVLAWDEYLIYSGGGERFGRR